MTLYYTCFKWYTVQYMPSLTSPQPGMSWWFNFCSALLAMSAEGNSMKQWCVVPLGKNRKSNILMLQFPYLDTVVYIEYYELTMLKDNLKSLSHRQCQSGSNLDCISKINLDCVHTTFFAVVKMCCLTLERPISK